MYTARKAAEREYDALETVYPDVSVPRPVDHNRHAVVMERVEGVELATAALDPGQAVGVLDLILEEVAAAYRAGFVHADVSEYNVFVASDGVTLFDWPQAVPTDHENARELLARDVANIVGYVRRKHPGRLGAVDTDALAGAVAGDAFASVRDFAE